MLCLGLRSVDYFLKYIVYTRVEVNTMDINPHEDHTEKLESLREQCLAADHNARRIWK